MNATQFPAGLNDNQFEIFEVEGRTFALNNGKRLSYEEFPEALLTLIDNIIVSSPKVIAALNKLNIRCPHERRKQFIKCNLSNFDYTADISACMKKIVTEYVSCPVRGNCEYEGKLCTGISAPNGKVSLRELRIMGLIRNGFYDKEICDTLNIALDTLKTTKKNIQRKFRIQRKAMIASVATINQIF